MVLRIIEDVYAEEDGPLREHLRILSYTYIRFLRTNHSKSKPKSLPYWLTMPSLRIYKKKKKTLVFRNIVQLTYKFIISGYNLPF